MQPSAKSPKSFIVSLLAGAAIGVLATTVAPAAMAAEADATATGSQLEEVVVTGSRIRGAAPVGSTVIAVGREEMQAQGALTTSDALKLIPQVSLLGADESHRGAQGGVSNIFYGNQVNLRALGPQATLTLLNGHRAPSTGTAGFSLDPSVLPTISIDRMEVVADGASAIYGSDAIAGVANLITRKNFEGLEVNARFGVADSYDQRQIGIIAGKRWDRGGFMVALENAWHSQLRGVDRDFFKSDLRPQGGTNFSTNQCNPGTLTIGGVTYAIPAAGVTQATANTLVAGTRNTCDFYNARGILPRQNRTSFTFAADYALTDGIKLYADGYAYRREFKLRTGSTLLGQTFTIPSTNPYFIRPAGATANTETVAWYVPGIGDFIAQTGNITSYQLTGGVDFNLPYEWKGQLQTSYGRDDSYAQYQQLNAVGVTAITTSTNPATALNPFANGVGTNSQATLDQIFASLFQAPGRNTQLIFQGKADGGLFKLPAGAVRAAVGFEYRDEMLTTGNSIGPVGGRTNIRYYPDRQISSEFAEILIPLVGPDMGVPLVRKLDFDAAIRHEKYSDAGGTTNPKYGVNWSPVEGLLLRASYGESFRAPVLSNYVSTSASLQVSLVPDPRLNNAQVGVLFINEANPSVAPETATTKSFGIDIDPPQLPGFHASVNYFDIDYQNQITSILSLVSILQQEAIYSSLIIRNPTAAQLAPYLARLPLRNGTLPNPVAALIDARPQNLGGTLLNGVDWVFTYRWTTETLGDFNAGFTGTYFTKYAGAVAPGLPVVNQLNRINYPQRYNFRLIGGWRNANWQQSFTYSMVSGYFNNTVTPFQRIDAFKTVDSHTQYNFNPETSHWALKNLSVSLDVLNLADQDPPYVNIAGGFDPNAATAIGRQFMVTLNKKF